MTLKILLYNISFHCAAVKHEELIERLLSTEKEAEDKEEEALTSLARRVFAEKKERIRRLEEEEEEEEEVRMGKG